MANLGFIRGSLLVLICLSLLWGGVLGQKSAEVAPIIAGCQVFPEDNIWNTPVDTLPVHPNSDLWVQTIGADDNVHPDFGSGVWPPGSNAPIGIPYVDVPGTQPLVDIHWTAYGDQSDPGPYPVPPDAPIEGGPDADGDRHVLVLDRDNCQLYELFHAYPNPDNSWDADSGAIFDLSSNDFRPLDWTSADAAGLPILPGLIRYDEVEAGEITHALRFTVPQTRNEYVWPATHMASSLTGVQYPPMGQYFRLKANFDISGFSPETQVILTALKKYGMILADNGSSWYLSGTPDERWDNDILRELRDVQGSDFEAVDVSGLMVSPDSGQVLSPPRNLNITGDLSTAPVKPALTWTGTAGASWYWVAIYSDSGSMFLDEWVSAADYCVEPTCTLDTSLLDSVPDYGMINGDYVMWVAAFTAAGNVLWSDVAGYSFSVTVPATADPTSIVVEPNQGRPSVLWPDDAGIFWVQMWMGSGTWGDYFAWHERDGEGNAFTCDGMSCTLDAAWDTQSGMYQVWMQVWGPGGASNWVQASSLVLPPDAAETPLNPGVVDAGAATPEFTWTSGAYSTWYEVTLEPQNQAWTWVVGWFPATAIGCAEPAQSCSYSEPGLANGVLPDDDYTLRIRAWGPGGMSGYADGTFTYTGGA